MKRIYVVTEKNGTGETKHLVKASTQAAAIKAIADPKYTAEVADAETCIDLSLKGVKVVETGNGE